MKQKTSILLTILFSVSTAAFGQKEPVKPTAETKPPTEVKATVETKPSDAKTPAKLPTAPEILAKYVQAIGGRAASDKIKTRLTKGTLEFASLGVKGTYETYTAAPNKAINRVNLAGIGEIVEGFDGTTAWIVNPLQGNRDKAGEELAQTKLSYDFSRETNLEKLYPKMEVRGIEKVGTNDAYAVLATPAGGLPAETFYFDTKSGLLVRRDGTSISPEGRQEAKTFLEDYRDVDGVKMPFRSRAITSAVEIVIVVTEVKNNVAVEDARFAKPKQ